MDEDEQWEHTIPASAFGKVLMASYSEINTSYGTSPVTPTSVLPSQFMGSLTSDEFGNISCSSPLLRSLRVQAVGKLNPVDMKRLSFHMPPNMGGRGYRTSNLKKNEDDEIMEDVEAESKSLNQRNNVDEEMVFEIGAGDNSEGTEVAKVNNERDCCMENSTPEIEMAEAALTPEAREFLNTPDILSHYVESAPPPTSTLISPMSWADVGAPLPRCDPLPAPMLQPNRAALPPPPLFVQQPNVKRQLPPSPLSLPPPMLQHNIAKAVAELSQLPLQILLPLLLPPPPMSLPNVAAQVGALKVLPPPTHTPMQSETLTGVLPLPPPPPPSSTISSNGSMSLMPAPPSAQAKRAAPPPPPPGATRSLCPKKAQTKLRRSKQMGNLYHILKRKVEGGNPNIRSAVRRKGSPPSCSGGKQGLADALAEMTKRFTH